MSLGIFNLARLGKEELEPDQGVDLSHLSVFHLVPILPKQSDEEENLVLLDHFITDWFEAFERGLPQKDWTKTVSLVQTSKDFLDRGWKSGIAKTDSIHKQLSSVVDLHIRRPSTMIGGYPFMRYVAASYLGTQRFFRW